MKLKSLILIVLLIGLLACNNDDGIKKQIIEGEYVGIFERNGITSNVQLNLDDSGFSGESDTQKFPAICNGTYSISDNSINFSNACIWTADFDWTLILSKEWNFDFKNNTLVLVHSNGDKYTLTKQ
ncbi:hypothetical protein MTsPCn9_13180 [Croceitalea sp. MTPC9]|uniref:hypothetical protein n=1 Tax=unclassified Croceitalea TaxID=2632280 RepID=UPI002B3C29F0|nr:hypothetical protein MTsPCn6_15950 [Croceitalea sp. MTPC6]GMN16382.1 hypothetical protein MTsPCn9_13180 [Croceitalea sp. MTPC9]